jgi:site-specific DNA recombinase
VKLIAEAFAAQRLVLASPELSLNQIAKANGRCRKQMAKLLSISWLSPRIIDAITDGVQPSSINRTRLLETALPLAWSAQEALFGIGA